MDNLNEGHQTNELTQELIVIDLILDYNCVIILKINIMLASLAETKACEWSLCNIPFRWSIAICESPNLQSLAAQHAQSSDITYVAYQAGPVTDQTHQAFLYYVELMFANCHSLPAILSHAFLTSQWSLCIDNSPTDLVDIYAPNQLFSFPSYPYISQVIPYRHASDRSYYALSSFD
jgi:hypothetical protein